MRKRRVRYLTWRGGVFGVKDGMKYREYQPKQLSSSRARMYRILELCKQRGEALKYGGLSTTRTTLYIYY